MEEKIKRLRYMVGLKFARLGLPYCGWAVGLSFYWFSLAFFKRWSPDMFSRDGPLPYTGFVFAWSLNSKAKEGDLLWVKRKSLMWPDYPKEKSSAA